MGTSLPSLAADAYICIMVWIHTTGSTACKVVARVASGRTLLRSLASLLARAVAVKPARRKSGGGLWGLTA